MSMEQNGNQNMSAANFCRNGCGFYAAQAFDGMCSKCYKDLKELQQASQAAVTSVTPSSLPSSSPSSSTAGRVSLDSNKKTDVDVVATSLSRTSLGDMNLNSSSNSGSNDKLSEKFGGSGSSSNSGNGGAVGGVSEVETASPTVATVKASDKADECGEGTSTVEGESGSSDGEKGKKAKKNRCMECRKKVGLTGFQCHCGKLFCSLHRYSDTHDCTFDFKEQGQQEIRKNNPVVKGEKVQKI